MPTIELRASQLATLLRPVLPLADRGVTLPILAGVYIRTTKTHVTATATDRYRAGIQRVKIEAPPKEPVRAVLGTREAKAILSIFKATRRNDPTLSLDFAEAQVTVKATGGLDGMLSGELAFGLTPGEYPAIDSIFVDAFKADERAETAAINPAFLADFQHAAQGTSTGCEPMMIRAKDNGLCAVQIGDDFRGVIRSVRLDDDLSKRLSLDGWELDPPKTAKAVDAA